MSKSRSDNLAPRKIFSEYDFSGKAALILATFFGVGFIRIAPGTFGTLAAVPLAFGLGGCGIWTKISCFLLITVLAIWSSGRAGVLLGQADPPLVVIDEVAGFLLVMSLLPFSWLILVSALVLFRLFDIFKPFPIKLLERRIKGGMGVVFDDLLAGVYAYVAVKGLLLLLISLDIVASA
jgi:phosphatidylglycerophosphatase A